LDLSLLLYSALRCLRMVLHLICWNRSSRLKYLLLRLSCFSCYACNSFRTTQRGCEWIRIWARNLLFVCASFFSRFGLLLFWGRGRIRVVFVQLFIGSVIGAFVTSELARSSYVITTIGASMRQNLPLPMALEMAAVGQDNNGPIFFEI